MEQKVKNRWLIAASAVGLHLCIGSIYAYSLWIMPLKALNGWEKSDISMAFSVAILVLGFSAAFLGPRVEAMGPRKSGMMSGLFYALGTFGAALGVHLNSLPLFIFFYGVVGGIGLGTGYTTPVPVLVRWFPDKRGLATGMAIMGFGFASLLFGPLISLLCIKVGPVQAFCILGVAYFCLMTGASLYLSPPPAGWQPGNADTQKAKNNKPKMAVQNVTAKEALRTKRFYLIWLMMFINISCGIALISVASPMAQEMAGLTELQAASLVGIMGLLNGLGRLGWSSFSDWLGRVNTYIIMFSIEIVAFVLLVNTNAPLLFQVLLVIIITCYGGGFSTLPALLSDVFGVKQLATIQGYALTAWSMAGLAGPILINMLLTNTGSYTYALFTFTGMLCVALVTAFLLRLDLQKSLAKPQMLQPQG